MGWPSFVQWTYPPKNAHLSQTTRHTSSDTALFAHVIKTRLSTYPLIFLLVISHPHFCFVVFNLCVLQNIDLFLLSILSAHCLPVSKMAVDPHISLLVERTCMPSSWKVNYGSWALFASSPTPAMRTTRVPAFRSLLCCQLRVGLINEQRREQLWQAMPQDPSTCRTSN